MITDEIMQARVQRGAAWLDERYPRWYASINLETLSLSTCSQCILGQVWSGHCTVAERNQLISQIIKGWSEASQVSWHMVPGYDVFKRAIWPYREDRIAELGFLLPTSELYPEDEEWVPGQADEAYRRLTDTWTQLIISRRLAEHPDTIKRVEEFVADSATGFTRLSSGRRLEPVA
jgi:hypothetical protein